MLVEILYIFFYAMCFSECNFRISGCHKTHFSVISTEAASLDLLVHACSLTGKNHYDNFRSHTGTFEF